MMVSKIGLDLTVFNDIEPLSLDILNNTKEILDQIPVTANKLTFGYLGYGMIGSIFMIVFIALSDKTPYGNFRYDTLPALGLSFAVCSIFSLFLLNLNFINNIFVVSTSVFMLMITMLLIVYTEGR